MILTDNKTLQLLSCQQMVQFSFVNYLRSVFILLSNETVCHLSTGRLTGLIHMVNDLLMSCKMYKKDVRNRKVSPCDFQRYGPVLMHHIVLHTERQTSLLYISGHTNASNVILAQLAKPYGRILHYACAQTVVY